MDFRKQIARNKRDSWFLMVIIVLILLALGFVIGTAVYSDYTGGLGLLGGFGVVAGLWSLIGYYGGAGMALAVSGAKEVTHEQEPQLWNVVEEMSVASGLPMPKVYVIESDAANAFATGRDPDHAAVAVTRGLMERLNREELQGVIGHEMSHVRNYDIRFATLIGIMVGVIALAADFFLRWGFFFGGGRRRGGSGDAGAAGAIFFIIAIVLAILAPFFAYMVQFAISRKREYLADASGVELTRNPTGLANALEKIAADPVPLKTANRATAHLFIANPLRKERAKSGLFDTHPPIQERIARLRAMAFEGPRVDSPAAQASLAGGGTQE